MAAPETPYRLSLRQTQIESARGMLLAAARSYAGSPLGEKLADLAQQVTDLREPNVVMFYHLRALGPPDPEPPCDQHQPKKRPTITLKRAGKAP